ncbi:hypothetical protein LTR62_007523 [Meristemomyces frigidus]|uniref:Pyruvate dehydrogenase protein x component n=1 Tax=Meristemomyces frigidus TaxID=1508187 RepID=A0AAN7TIV1_9PEZI|nr:hypothetical protein LTR62_007523 [Meristemomyces frigidus]
MPALSPTMTEGNIASWSVKEGDSFSAGDVILEVETDKATMDVEAQDDGVMVKIMSEAGSKGVKVGNRIAVIAEAGDDVSSIEIPAEDKAQSSQGEPARKERPSPQEKLAGGIDTIESSPSAAEAPPSSAPESDASARGAAANTGSSQDRSAKSQGGRAHKQTYPLYPSVEHLLHQNGMTKDDASSIPASGPNGRLLKGDVLAHLGQIKKDYPSQSAARLTKLSHLDLSNIQLSKPAVNAEAKKEAAPAPEEPTDTELAVPISLSAVIATQKRVNDSLGIFLPLSTFIARASELANEDLPLSKHRKPTADDLFNSVLGLDKITGSKSSRGHFTPQITGLSIPAATPARPTKKGDIIDLLSSKSAETKTSVANRPGALGISAGANVFSVTAKSGEERRAAEYLERMKMALEMEPGRLVL